MGNRGITEETTDSDPAVLLGNHFYSPRQSATLYVDRYSSDSGVDLISDVHAINVLSDVPVVADNTFTQGVPSLQ